MLILVIIKYGHFLFKKFVDYFLLISSPLLCKRIDAVLAEVGAYGAGADRIAGNAGHNRLKGDRFG